MIAHVGEMKHTGTQSSEHLCSWVSLADVEISHNKWGWFGFSKETCELEDDLMCSLYQGLYFPLALLHRELLGVQGCSVKIPRMTRGPELHINS